MKSIEKVDLWLHHHTHKLVLRGDIVCARKLRVDMIQMWIFGDPEAEPKERFFQVVSTRQKMPDDASYITPAFSVDAVGSELHVIEVGDPDA